MSKYPPYSNPPYQTVQFTVGDINLSSMHLVCTPDEAADLIARFEAAVKEAGQPAINFSTAEQGTGHFAYYLIPGDPRRPLAIVDDKGNVWAGFAGEWVWQINERGVGYPGHVIFAPIPNNPDKKPVFQWIWDE